MSRLKHNVHEPKNSTMKHLVLIFALLMSLGGMSQSFEYADTTDEKVMLIITQDGAAITHTITPFCMV